MTHDPEADRREADRYLQACKAIEAGGLRDFLDFLCKRKSKRSPVAAIQLCERIPVTFETRRLPTPPSLEGWHPISADVWGERILAAYFDIDLDAVDRHRRRILADLNAQPERTSP